MSRITWRNGYSLLIKCPGCGFDHTFFRCRYPDRPYRYENEVWWNESEDLPTLKAPDTARYGLLFGNRGPSQQPTCFFTITDGKIKFDWSSEHEHRGQVLELPDCFLK